MVLLCGWELTVHRRYLKQRSGVYRIVEMVLLSSTIAFLKESEETSGQAMFLLAMTCIVFGTIICILLSHLLLLHQSSPSHPIRLRRCRLPHVVETVHDGVSCIMLLPATLMFLLPPTPSPFATVAAVLTVVLVLLLGMQCGENLRTVCCPGSSPEEQEEDDGREMEQRTPTQDSNAPPIRRYTPNANRWRGTSIRWSKHRKHPPSHITLSPPSMSQLSYPSISSPRSSHLSSGDLSSYSDVVCSTNSSQPLPLLHSSMPHYGPPIFCGPRSSPHSSTSYSVPLSSLPTPLSSTSVPVTTRVPIPHPISPFKSSSRSSPHPLPQSGFLTSSISSSSFPSSNTAPLPHTSMSEPKSPILSSPRSSPCLSSYSGVPLSSLSPSPHPLPKTAMSHSPQIFMPHLGSPIRSNPRSALCSSSSSVPLSSPPPPPVLPSPEISITQPSSSPYLSSSSGPHSSFSLPPPLPNNSIHPSP